MERGNGRPLGEIGRHRDRKKAASDVESQRLLWWLVGVYSFIQRWSSGETASSKTAATNDVTMRNWKILTS